MAILKKLLCGLTLWMISHISGYSQSNFVEFNTIPKSGTALIYSHQDDDLIWMLPFWNITEKFIGGAMPSTPTFETIVHEQQVFLNDNGYNIDYESNWITPWGRITHNQYEQYYWGNYPSLSYLADDHLIAFWNDNDNVLVRKEINRIKSKLEQYIASPDVSRIITHNNWGEYGHQQHKALNVAVRELSVKYRKDVWISDFYLNGNIPSDIKYTLGRYNTPELYSGIKSIYKNHNCWTWIEDVPSGDHKYIKIVEHGVDKSNILTGESVATTGPLQNEPGAYIFDGVDDYMTLNGNNNASFTISMRIRPDQIMGMDISKMAEYPSSTGFDRSLYMQSDGKITAHVFNGGSKSVTSTTSLSSGVWTNLIMSGDGNNLKLYINGILEGSVYTGSTFTFFNSPEFVLGQMQETSNFFKGQIKNIQFYDYILSDEEIALLQGIPPPVTYVITSDAGIGGTINPSGTVAALNGSTRTYNITPDFGYMIEDVMVDNISAGAVSSYTFTNIIADHTITATFLPGSSIALNKPVSSQSYEDGRGPSFANDADGTDDSYWAAGTFPQWWKVDLGAVYDISGIIIRNYVDNTRYYHYTIEASIDDVTYSQVAVKLNTNPATDAGDSYPLSVTARYLRVTTTYNSANTSVHITDFRVFGTEPGKTNLTISGLKASNKVYDGTTAATLNTGSAVLVGVKGGDVVTLISTEATGTFANKTVGTNKSVTTSGFTIAGADAGKYTLIHPSTTANITAVALTVSGVKGNNRVYNGTTVATLNTGSAILAGVLEGDVAVLVSTGATGSFGNKNIGTGKIVTTTGFTLSGADAGNYTLTQPITAANITPRPVTVTADAKIKVVGDPDPALTYQITSGNLVGTDALAGSLSRIPGESAGIYAILQNTLTNSNYNITYIGGDLNISLVTGIKPITQGEFGFKVYPNPFTDHLYFELQWDKKAKAKIEIFGISGVKMATIFSDKIEANQVYRLEYTPENIKAGVLFYRLVIDEKLIFTDKLIHLE